MLLHDIPAQARRAIDVSSLGTAGVSGVLAYVTLSNVALTLTIFSLLLNIIWMVLKYLYLGKHGAEAFWGSNRDD